MRQYVLMLIAIFSVFSFSINSADFFLDDESYESDSEEETIDDLAASLAQRIKRFAYLRHDDARWSRQVVNFNATYGYPSDDGRNFALGFFHGASDARRFFEEYILPRNPDVILWALVQRMGPFRVFGSKPDEWAEAISRFNRQFGYPSRHTKKLVQRFLPSDQVELFKEIFCYEDFVILLASCQGPFASLEKGSDEWKGFVTFFNDNYGLPGMAEMNAALTHLDGSDRKFFASAIRADRLIRVKLDRDKENRPAVKVVHSGSGAPKDIVRKWQQRRVSTKRLQAGLQIYNGK